ncbi:MAG: hypothetical protein IKT24_03785 [Clostridia bacterium]|nr:hypothetical protein [Clostridia bacterium]
MKKNVVFRIAAIVLMCTLVTACFASSTFAKYTAGATANNASLTVATWSIKAGKTAGTAAEIAGNPTAKFDIASTITDTNAADNQDATLICPGTEGKFEFVIVNNSQVDADYVITLDKTGLADLEDVITFTDNNTLTGVIAQGATKTVTITWEWPFHVDAATDNKDTAHGKAGGTYELGATITVNQAADNA